MFTPKYTITDRLLDNIKRINNLVNELNNRRFQHVVLAELERTARAVSAYASTSIEGNPLPLTEVKKILKSKPAHIRNSEKEVLNYNQALQDLNKRLSEGKVKLSLPLILIIQKQVIASLLPRFETGYLRERAVVVNDPRTSQVVYLPPDAKDVKSLVEDLISFVNSNRDKIDLTSWLEYFTGGIIDELLRVQKNLPEVGISPETYLQSYHLKILEFIKEKGFIADRDYAKLVTRAKATRALDFKKLIDLGLISRKAKGKATYYILKEK